MLEAAGIGSRGADAEAGGDYATQLARKARIIHHNSTAGLLRLQSALFLTGETYSPGEGILQPV